MNHAFASAALLGLLACGPAAATRPVAPGPASPPVAAPSIVRMPDEAPVTAPGAPREIAPGVLRANLVEGQLIVDDVPGVGPRHAWVHVCVDVDGAVTATLDRTDHPDDYDNLALAAASAWKFRPFVTAAGEPEAVCSEAHFLARHPKRPVPDEMLAGLPPALTELPPSREIPAALPAGATQIAPAANLGVVRRCRRPGADDAPTVALVQSSGDELTDRAMLARRQTRPVDEPAEPSLRCWLGTEIVLPPPAPLAEPAPSSSVVAPLALEHERIAGEKLIYPTDLVKVEIARSGQHRLMIPIKVCVDIEGRVSSVDILGPGPGFLGYELDLLNAIAGWRYRPFTVDGRPAPVCSVVQFVYSQA